MHKKIIALSSTLALSLFLAGCNAEDSTGQESTPEDDTTEEESSADDTNEEVELTLWTYYTPEPFGNVLDDYVERFEEENENITLNIEYVPFNEMRTQLSVGTAGDTLPDMVIMDSVEHASFSEMGVLADITDRLTELDAYENYLEGPLASNELNGSYYGVPFEANSLGMFYNTDIFEEIGTEPPTTWDELVTVSEEILDYDDSIVPFGMTAVRNEQSTFHLIPFLYSAGATYDDLTSDEAVETLTFQKEMLDNNIIHSDFLSQDQDDIGNLFLNGNVAMMINGPWMINRLQENEELDFEITGIPMKEEPASVLGGANLALVDNDNVDAAWEFVEFVSDKDTVFETALRAGTFPVREDVMDESNDWMEQPVLEGLVEPMRNAVPRGPSAHWPQVSENIQLAIQSVLTEEATPEEALEEAQQNNNEYLE